MKSEDILKILMKIRPTEEEVETMSEDDWMKLIYPIKCFHAGVKFAKGKQEEKDEK